MPLTDPKTHEEQVRRGYFKDFMNMFNSFNSLIHVDYPKDYEWCGSPTFPSIFDTYKSEYRTINNLDNTKYIIDLPGIDPSTIKVKLVDKELNISYGYNDGIGGNIKIVSADFTNKEIKTDWNWGQVTITVPTNLPVGLDISKELPLTIHAIQ